MTVIKKKIIVTVAAIVAVTALVILFLYNPLTAGFYPRCPSKLLTGYDCPGCGSLRGMHSMLHGDFAAAWSYNPAIFVALMVLMAIGIAGIHRRPLIAKRSPRWLNRLSSRTARIVDHPAFPITILLAIVAWTILRNI